ncbi:MAG: HEPN domain-containing protein [Lamprobacter sp.]|uniref:HEPN domain-containing protein n=1 Tax=Lamprobacter sp. TaxID=3100796 RepID=UPI002B25C464|nr:HEPN domain-containing protein [Lamprobacter sp.]MEA3644060.1 HEPN domain-containing protein [Lamprobacter sp.]
MTPECNALLTAAEAKLRAADLLLAEGLPDDAASRAYYAAFHAVSAIHLAQGNAFSSDAQVAAEEADAEKPATLFACRASCAAWLREQGRLIHA